MTVIPFAKPAHDESEGGWLGGEGHCLDCKHKWAAVAPVGTWRLDCPECGSGKGIWRYPIMGHEGCASLVCNCGGEALSAYQKDGYTWLRCMTCGSDQTETFFGE